MSIPAAIVESMVATANEHNSYALNINHPVAIAVATGNATCYLGAKPPADLAARQPSVTALDVPAAFPDSFDLRTLGKITPIKNQQQCGSCWCFSAVAAAESAALNAGHKNVKWSEQEILNCGPNGGCNGDWPETAFEHMKSKGTTDDAEVPYTQSSGNGVCTAKPKNRIKNYYYLAAQDGVATDDQIKTELMKGHIVTCAVAVDNNWAAYGGGIYKTNRRFSQNDINHAVDIVAWFTVNGKTVWVVRNHWDTSWGEEGYMRTESGANLIGFGAMACEVESDSPPPTPPVPPQPPTPPLPPIATPFSGDLSILNSLFAAKQVTEDQVKDALHAALQREGFSFANLIELLKIIATLMQALAPFFAKKS